MKQTAKLFSNGRSQAVRLPAEYRFDGVEVFIRRDALTGDIILSRKPENWNGFLHALEGVQIPEDFLDLNDRKLGEHRPDPFDGWKD